jgi:hypothetical protein
MHIAAERLAHLSPANICNCMESQTVVEFIVVHQILAYAVDNQMNKLMLLMEEESDGKVTNLFLRVLGGGDQIYGFQMAKVDIESVDLNVQKLQA